MPRVMAFDVGAIRMGWAVIDANRGDYSLVAYGVKGVTELAAETFRDYRWRLIDYWVYEFPELVVEYNPDMFVSEEIPMINHGGKFGNLQRIKGLVAITVCQALNIELFPDKPWRVIAANTAKLCVANNNKATKVAVRNAVAKVFPELEEIKKTLVPDMTDAIGLALTGAGYGE